MRRLVLLLLAGCAQDPTEVMMHLVGNGSVDEVDVVGIWGGSSQKADHTMGMATALPFDVLVLMPPVNVTARFDVTGRLGGQVVGTGSSQPVLVFPHEISHITVVLGENDDLGVTDDLAMADLTGEDFSEADLTTPPAVDDLANPPDLNSAQDMTKPLCSGPSTCPAGGSPPCTGFENVTPDAPFTTLTRTGCTAVIDSTRACRGSKSLHVTTPSSAGGSLLEAFVLEQTFLPTSSATPFYVRAFLYLAAPVGDDNYVVQAYQSFSPYAAATLILHPSGTLQTGNSVANLPTSPSATHFPMGRWVCVEWRIDTAPSGSIHTYLDGSEVTDIAQTGITTQPSPAFDTVAVGLSENPTGSVGASEMWVDEVRVDTSRIGCVK